MTESHPDSHPDFAALRRRKKLSQSELARLVGVSQATISRIEKGEHSPELRLLAKMARALGVELRELISDERLHYLMGQQEEPAEFYTFCQNPFCHRNEFKSDGHTAKVYWRSGQMFPMVRYSEVNFCPSCGTDLVKECRGCGRPLTAAGAHYCISCGRPLTERPSEDEWKKIREALSASPEKDDDIPF